MAFDQEEAIRSRDAAINKLESEAAQIREIAVDVHKSIESQGAKINQVNSN